MDMPTRTSPSQVADETFVLPGWLPIPELGLLPMNAFLIRGEQPVLIDTGPAPLAAGLASDLEQLLDLEDLRWVWLTHTDPDHRGGLGELLAMAPNARIVTPFLGMGKLLMEHDIPPERFHLIRPGELLDVGDRRLMGYLPPVFDAPETVAPFDARTRSLFAADCFGTLLHEPASRAEEIGDDPLSEGMITWARIDVPWLEMVDPSRFHDRLASLHRMDPKRVLSAHLPPSHRAERLLTTLERAAGVLAFGGPEQPPIEAMQTA